MRQEDKSITYNRLLAQYDKISNKISEIKGQSLELNQTQLSEIRKLEIEQANIRIQVQRLIS